MPDYLPSASLSMLQRRAELLGRLRTFFSQRGFLEVETPIASVDIVVDRHLDPFATVLAPDPRRPQQGRTLYLQTSPEFAMKRLLCAGAEAIYQVARVFRNGERGPLHNPEFTMVEWYRRGDDMAAGMRLLGELCTALLPRGEPELASYAEVFARYATLDGAGLDPHTCDVEDLQAAARQHGLNVGEEFAAADRDAWLDVLLTELVQPHLGQARPTIVYHYPSSQAALARLLESPGRPPVAERFELYVDGIELANGYHELLDPDVLRRRAAAANMQRQQDGKPPLPETSRLLEAMDAGLPPCSGTALGFDRLVMVAAGARSIDEVLAFPIERA